MTVGTGPLEAAQPDQLPLGPVRRLVTVTPARLLTFASCPRRYRMAYLDRPPPPAGPPWAHTGLGAAVHSALRALFDLPGAQRTPDRAATLLRGFWTGLGFRDAEQERRWADRCATWVRGYAPRCGFEPVGVERTVAMRTPTVAFSGRIDRLDRRGEELAVVDYKTSRRPPEPDAARTSLPLALYAAAAARTLRRQCPTVELHHLPSGTVVAHRHDPDSLDRHVRRAEAIAADLAAAIAANRFEPRPGPQCGWCDLRRHCREGSAASPAREPWAGLGEEP